MKKYMKMTFLLLLAMSANSLSNAGIIDWSKNKISNTYSWVQNHPKTILVKNKANNAYSWIKDHPKTILVKIEDHGLKAVESQSNFH